MASYVDNALLPNEAVLYRAHVSKWSLFWTIFFGAVMFIAGAAVGFLVPLPGAAGGAVLAIIGIVLLVRAWITYGSTEFGVTDRRIIAKTGLVSRRTVEMFLDKVESLNVTQSVMGRVLDFGTVGIRGTGSTEEAIDNISAPLELRKQFMAAADLYRRKV